MDWSDKPLVAAYFASKGAAEAHRSATVGVRKAAIKKAAAPNMGVWALNLDWVIRTAFPAEAKNLAVYVVTAPRASNPNLHAQGGVFTTENISLADFNKPVAVRTVNELVDRQWRKLKHRIPVMAHFTLPSSEAGRVLRLLYQEGISAATLFPGYQGVADSLAERALWDKPERASYWIST